MSEVHTAEEVDGAIIDMAQADADEKAYVPTPFDDLAREMGWKPPTEYNGSEAFRSAEEYIKHGIAGTKRLKNDLKAVKDTADRLARTSATITAKALEDQRRELEQQHDQAVEDGDKVEARRVAKELAKIDDAPVVSDVKEAVAELQAEGITPTLDDIAQLIDLARAVQEPVRRTSPWYEGDPVRVGQDGPVLRPLSIQGGEWFDWAMSVFPDEKLRGAAFCFAAVHGHKSGAFEGLWSRPAAETALVRFIRSLPCTRGALESAAARIMDTASPGDTIRARKDDADGFDLGDVLAKLEALTGKPREYWVLQSHRYTFRVLEHAIRYNMAGSAFASSDAADDPEYLRASFDFNAAVQLIRERAANVAG